MTTGLFGWAKDIKDSISVLNAELKVTSDEVIFYSKGKDSDKNKKLQEFHVSNLKKNINSLKNFIKGHLTLSESIDISPYLSMWLGDPVFQGVFPAPEFGENATVEVFDFERPPFKIYYLPNNNSLVWARLRGKEGSKWPKQPENPDLNDTREATDEDWCKKASLIALQLVRNLPEDLQKETEIFFGKNR